MMQVQSNMDVIGCYDVLCGVGKIYCIARILVNYESMKFQEFVTFDY